MTTGRRGAEPVRGSTSLSPPAIPPFPGIASPRCHDCTWVWRGGRMEVKYVNRVCPVHGRALEVAQPC